MGSAGDRLSGAVAIAPMRRFQAIALTVAMLFGGPLAAKDSLGVFGQWGAFRDGNVPRCYAIAEAEPPRPSDKREQAPYATVGDWPQRGVRGEFHLRLSRQMATGAAVSLNVKGRRFALTGSGSSAWAADARMDAAIVAAMRSADTMSLAAIDRSGRRFTDRYDLEGAATAIDAATIGCSRSR